MWNQKEPFKVPVRTILPDTFLLLACSSMVMSVAKFLVVTLHQYPRLSQGDNRKTVEPFSAQRAGRRWIVRAPETSQHIKSSSEALPVWVEARPQQQGTMWLRKLKPEIRSWSSSSLSNDTGPSLHCGQRAGTVMERLGIASSLLAELISPCLPYSLPQVEHRRRELHQHEVNFMKAAGIFGRCVIGVMQMSKGRSLLAVTATRARRSASRQVPAGKRETLITWR
ncbi:hypothetical protein EV421DRAFT_1740096 [Armillaria borealis]|uniref:Uncharacterized protein n=1 Tax=Armillaria borealis TaxID=47425 RepID=A0AA39J3V5_9AGAR|nr:hypothetical protein EV421DRAFT_1740096 [Armillaria borealis]